MALPKPKCLTLAFVRQICCPYLFYMKADSQGTQFKIINMHENIKHFAGEN